MAARTLFFRDYMETLSPQERRMRVGAGEMLQRDAYGHEWLVRREWPSTHPLRDEAVSPLGHRILDPTAAMDREWTRLSHPAGSTSADQLGKALWEIFQNSERHALTTGGSPIPRAVRMLIATPLNTVPSEGSDLALADYVQRVRTRFGEGTNFVATSVLDSGDGLAYTAAARADVHELSAAAEITYLKMAVRGDSHSPDRPLHGYGMPEVAQLLSDMKGFMRIRSGSLSISRDFDDSPAIFGKPDSPLNWKFDSEDQSIRRFGSAVTIILPRFGDDA